MEAAAPTTTEKQQQQQQQRLNLRRPQRPLSLPSESPPLPGDAAAAHGADPATLDDAKGSSAPGTPYGTRGHADRPDLDFLGWQKEEEEEGDEESQGGGEAPEPRRAFTSAAAAAAAASPPGPGGQQPPSSSEENAETIWDRLRGPKASEANAASAEAEAEGLVGPEARAREEAGIARKLGGGTGSAL